MCSLNDILKPLVMAEHFCEEQNCSLCMSAIKTAQELVVKNFTLTNSQSDAIALLKKLKHDMEICDDVLADIDKWIETISAVLAQQHT